MGIFFSVSLIDFVSPRELYFRQLISKGEPTDSKADMTVPLIMIKANTMNTMNSNKKSRS